MWVYFIHPMPTLRAVLDDATRKEFETPPIFDTSQRKIFFNIPSWANKTIKHLALSNNKVMFALQVGYFRAAGRFFEPNTFHNKDIESVCRRLKIKRDEVSTNAYHRNSRLRHQELILKGFGIFPFSGKVRELCFQEATHLVKRQIKLHLVFGSLAHFIREHYFEVPNYGVFASMINQARDNYENQIQAHFEQHLTPELLSLLTDLFEQYLPDNQKTAAQNSPFKLTKLRVKSELMGVKVIRENVADLRSLKGLYERFLPILKALELSDNFIEELAIQVLRSRSPQVKRWKNRNLYLICFIQYQYFYLSDVLTQTFTKAVEQNINLCEKTYKIQRQQEQEANIEQLVPILESYLLQGELIENMQKIVVGLNHTEPEKLKTIANGLRENTTEDFIRLLPAVKKLYLQTTRQTQDEGYFIQIAAGSQKMQMKVGDMLRYLSFSGQKSLQEAIDFYQKKEGNLIGNIPIAFLKPNERKAVVDKDGKVQISLYKSLLARHLSKGLKTGAVYVTTSHEYKSLDTYLIDEKTWQEQKLTLMERANLRHLESWQTIQDQLQDSLTYCFNHTFDRINNGENLWLEKRKNGKLKFKTPTKEEPQIDPPNLYPNDRFISLFEALQTVNKVSEFTSSLESFRLQNVRKQPEERLIFAALMAYGCNLGIGRMEKSTRNISPNSIEATANNYLTSSNLQKTNDRVIAITNRMMIHKLFKKDPNITHTSSDGQKFDVLLDSIHANYSFKYFGKEKGISIYSFISDAHQIFHGLAFSASDREAWYVLNGLMHNDVVDSDIHSTDSHGSTDPVFALTYLLGIDFQPRIKEFYLQKLHGIAGMKIEQQQDYIINAGANINTKIIEEQWDNILRLVVSIKLKHTVPSQILKRLNSYALQNPLYLALKELGKVVRTIFLLRYMDDEVMRQRVHQQLVKIESFHGLSDAISFGNNGQIIYANKEELLVMEGCKRLLENVVICWNYLFLTRSIVKASPNERKEILKTIPDISTVAWEHFNFQGEFDFDESQDRDELEQDLQAMFDFQIDEDDMV